MLFQSKLFSKITILKLNTELHTNEVLYSIANITQNQLVSRKGYRKQNKIGGGLFAPFLL